MKQALYVLFFYTSLTACIMLGITVIDNHMEKRLCAQYQKDTGKSTTFYDYRGCFVTMHNGNMMRLTDYKDFNHNWKDK